MGTEQHFYALPSLQKGAALEEFYSRGECHRNSWGTGSSLKLQIEMHT